MGFDFDQIFDKARVAVGAVAKKTDEVVEYSKLKYEHAKLTTELSRLYQELGMATYEAMKGEEGAEVMDSITEEIDLLLLDLAALDDIMDEKKKVVTCPKCGIKIDQESAFCSRCGASLTQKEPCEECEPKEEDKCKDCDRDCSDCEA